ncbi:hypothetical protein Tdes44962_MAKER06336 [Teratosphaeria destructans]|uniref:Uncharacterized protein n=1 Tax=Teratosphaeria destructans TaxID=418781 RepID=A0A9W7VXI1_9PEZI|nr:hypothetical protein Tdes44962_MAKER06336 [Teratosphaeria destructans]
MYHQHSYSQGHSGPPPAKRPKGNPIITKYPPPPGYRRPSQPPVWTPPVQQPYGFQPNYPTYGQPVHQVPQWSGFQQPSNAPIVVCPPTAQPCYPNHSSAYTTPQPAWPGQGFAPTRLPPWQQPPSQHDIANNKRRHSSNRPQNTRNPSVTDPLDGNGDPLSPPRPGTGSESYQNALEHEFDDECYFSRHPDEIEPTLSLGLIEWHSALPTKLALPATFQEAELEALAPRKPRPANEESISEYFASDKAHEALLSVRQTDHWKEICDDVVYREFAVRAPHTLTLWELIEKYRDRPDPSWTMQSDRDPTPALSRGATPMHSTDDHDARSTSSLPDAEQSEQMDILGDLEQALFLNQQSNPTRLRSHSRTRSRAQSRSHSRTNSVSSSNAGERLTRPIPLAPIRDQNQENILAALGVTGSPKLVYQTPGPALGAPPPPSSSQHSRANSVCSVQSDTRRPRSRPASMEPTTQTGVLGSGRADKRYGDLDLDATPRPKYERVDSGRKRSFGEVEEQGEATPRQGRFKVVKA